MYGAAVDHIVAMTVVLANGRVVTASAAENEDLFFALRGAAASFGIVVEFTFRTQPAPQIAIQFSCVVTAKRYVDMASTFGRAWSRSRI
jgi:FAD/FMN-containing dehydrogenase